MKNSWDDSEVSRRENIMNKNYAKATIINKNYDPRKRLKIFVKKNSSDKTYFLAYQEYNKKKFIPLGGSLVFTGNHFRTIKQAQKALIEWNECLSGKAKCLSDIPDLQHKWKV